MKSLGNCSHCGNEDQRIVVTQCQHNSQQCNKSKIVRKEFIQMKTNA